MDKEIRQARILIISVHYKSHSALLDMLGSLAWLKGNPEVDVIIADNASGEEELAELRPAVEEFPNASLLESATNRGYFGAARFAFDQYRTQGHSLPDWVIVCNHDILIEDSGFFTRLLQEDPEAVGVIAPRIQVLSGKADQNPFMRRRPGRLRWTQLRFVSSNYGVSAFWNWLCRRKAALRCWLAARSKDSPRNAPAKRETIYAAHGSFTIFSRRYFEAGGFLDGNLFLYGEEISVAEICRSLGLPVVYLPALHLLHREHESTGKVLSRFTFECQKNALRYLSSRYMPGLQGTVDLCRPNLRAR